MLQGATVMVTTPDNPTAWPVASTLRGRLGLVDYVTEDPNGEKAARVWFGNTSAMIYLEHLIEDPE
jgi:hypothetical protein